MSVTGKAIVWVDDCKTYNKKGRWGGGGNVFGNRYEATHVVDAQSPIGKRGTTGAVKFVDAAKLDFRPARGSASAQGGSPLQCVPADIDGNAYDTASPSRGCFQAGGQAAHR